MTRALALEGILHDFADFCIIKAQLACLELIQANNDFRLRRDADDFDIRCTRHLADAFGKIVRIPRQFLQITSAKADLDRTRIIAAALVCDDTDLHRADVREFLSKVCHDFRHGAVSVIERLQLDIDAAFIDRRSCAAQPHRRNADFRLFQNRFFQWLGPFLHLEKAHARRRFQVDTEFTRVIDRLQLSPYERDEEQVETKRCHGDEDDLPRTLDGIHHETVIDKTNSLKPEIELAKDHADDSRPSLGTHIRKLQPVGGKHRRQCIGADRREDDGAGDGQPELLEVLPDCLTHAADRHEYRQKGHGCGKDGQHQFLRRIGRGNLRPLAELHVAENIFNKDDGIVDQKTHGQRKAHEGHVIHREIERPHQEEGRDDGHRDGEAADDRRAKVP